MSNRVFCPEHDPHQEAQWKPGCRPLLDDTCYMCKCAELEQQLKEVKEEIQHYEDQGLWLPENNDKLLKLQDANRLLAEARFAENKELYGHWQNALTQNAKLAQANCLLIEALEKICDPVTLICEYRCQSGGDLANVMKRVAFTALKEVKGED